MATTAELTTAGGSATIMGREIAGLRTEVQGLGRTFGNRAVSNYATKLNAGATAATAMEARVAALKAEVAGLDAELSTTRTLGTFRGPGVPGAPGGGGGSRGDLGGRAISVAQDTGLTRNVTPPILMADAAKFR